MCAASLPSVGTNLISFLDTRFCNVLQASKSLDTNTFFETQITEKRAEYRQYLEQQGFVKALRKGITELYEEKDRPDDAIAYVTQAMCANCPEDAVIKKMKTELEEKKAQIAKIGRDIDRISATM